MKMKFRIKLTNAFHTSRFYLPFLTIQLWMLSVNASTCPNFMTIDPCTHQGGADLLDVSFGDCGVRLFPKSAESEPTIRYADAIVGTRYVLVMVDPDAPSRESPKYRWWRHWVVSDITGKLLLSGYSGSVAGNSLTDYAGPSPPQDSGPHRYQFYLFEQESEISDDNLGNHDRGSWDLNQFVAENGLCRHLVATYQFFAENLPDK